MDASVETAIIAFEDHTMQQIDTAQLKNRLNFYLNKVRSGEELIVRDRRKPIARIVPLIIPEDEDEETAQLIAEGIARPAQAELPESFWMMPRPRVRGNAALEALLAE